MNKPMGAGILACLCAVLAWGGMFPVMGAALKRMDPFYFTGIRYVAAGLILLLMLGLFEGVGAFRPDGRSRQLLFFGTAGFSGFGFLVFLGQKLCGESGSVVASVMMALMPLMTVIVQRIVRKTRSGSLVVVPMLVACFGTLLVITKGNPGELFAAGRHGFAILLILLGALCWVIYTVGGSFFTGWSALRYTALTTCFGSLSNLAIIGAATGAGALHPPVLKAVLSDAPELLYMILIAGVMAVFAWNVGNRRLGSLNGVLFMNVVPITTAVVNALRGNLIEPIQAVGIGIAILGLLLNNLLQRSIARRAAAPAAGERLTGLKTGNLP